MPLTGQKRDNLKMQPALRHPSSSIPLQRVESPTLSGFLSLAADLAKLKLTAMATVPAVLAYLAAGGGKSALLPLLMIGVFAAAAGSAALNQWSEREIDARMNRTRSRPLPAKRISSRSTAFIGVGGITGGTLLLAIIFNPLCAALALTAGLMYWLVYTPLKRRTPWCTEIGAISGALPPLIGWSAANGNLSLLAWVFFAILFLWQMPHFHPIAWRYREDYQRGGFQMRILRDGTGNNAANHSIAYAYVLLLVTIIPFFTGHTGVYSLAAVLLMGSGYCLATLNFRFGARDSAARLLFRFSLVHLPVVLSALAIDVAVNRVF